MFAMTAITVRKSAETNPRAPALFLVLLKVKPLAFRAVTGSAGEPVSDEG